MKKTFNNVQNVEIFHDGRTYWISRSVAVVGIHIAVTKDGDYILVEKRSKNMDQPNKWSLPCGYLDWNENAYEAIIRETYEETGWYIPDEPVPALFDNDCSPVLINTEPSTDPKQNVSLIFLFVHDCRYGLPKIEDFTSSEVDKVKWLSFNDFYYDSYFLDSSNWAFNHEKRIRQIAQKYAHVIG